MSLLKFVSPHFGDGPSSFLVQNLSKIDKSNVTYRIDFIPIRSNVSDHKAVGLDKIEFKWHFLLSYNGIEIYKAYTSVLYSIEDDNSMDDSGVEDILAYSYEYFVSNIKRVRKSIFVIPDILYRQAQSPEAISYTQQDIQLVLMLLHQY